MKQTAYTVGKLVSELRPKYSAITRITVINRLITVIKILYVIN
jgi:hypothetical protein